MQAADTDTIAALATAPGEAGIAVVRVSGPASLSIADRLVVCQPPPPSARPGGTFLHGHVRNAFASDVAGGSSVTGFADEVVVLIYRAPHSYTREDVVEFQGHGGRVASRRVLQAVLAAGARLAAPGEFTKRAFLNGRLDLPQAEAVANLIQARSDRSAQLALEQLDGSLSSCLTTLYDCVMSSSAMLEASFDFSEDDIPLDVTPHVLSSLRSARERVRALLGTWGESRLLRDGVLVVISGQPNVGKSTLLNGLLGVERAIVADMPGTTRDTIEEQLVLTGIPIRLVDTAGLRTTGCLVEQAGVERAMTSMARADLHLHVLDASVPLDNHARTQLSTLPAERTILVLNKQDLGCGVSAGDLPRGCILVPAVLRDGAGLNQVRDALIQRLGLPHQVESHVTIAERHRQCLIRAEGHLCEAIQLLCEARADLLVPAAAAIRQTAETIGEITGKTYTDDLLDAVFSRFCIGK